VRASRRAVAAASLAVALLLAAWGAPHAQAPAGGAAPVAPGPSAPPPFDEWLAELRQEALDRGFRPETVRGAFDGLEPLPIVIERDRSQAEFVLPLDKYIAQRLAPAVVRRARTHAQENATLLRRVEAAYGVPGSIIVAIWGVESNFGQFSGVRPTIQALATLAWDPRRSAYFRNELFDALLMVDRGDIDLATMKGSWAGAMGQPQFMPSSYIQYAVDFDGDGRKDIWGSRPDIFASIANYLAQRGWKRGERWGREVVVPAAAAGRVKALGTRDRGCRAARALTPAMPLAKWQHVGVRQPGGRALPVAGLDASLLNAGPRRFLVYNNYETLLTYNCAHAYALSVAMLADRIAAAQ
jgi:membrane-bound lytic murein transglycosylase B